MIEAGKVVCPGHTWAWDPATGATSDLKNELQFTL